MKNKKKEPFNQINILIDEERQLASQIMPERILQERLKKRLEKESRKSSYFFRSKAKVITSAAGIVFFILAGVFILILFQKTNYGKATVSSMAQFFEETPGVKNLIQMSTERSNAFPYEPLEAETELKSIAKAIQDFQAAHPLPSSKKSDQVFLRNPPHYDYSQMIELLFREKVIHHVMHKYWHKEKEGKNG